MKFSQENICYIVNDEDLGISGRVNTINGNRRL